MSRLPEEEFNFLVLHYLKRSRYAHLADSFESALVETDALPKRVSIDGRESSLTYDQLLERYGEADPNNLVSRFIWGAYEQRQFPVIEGPMVTGEPPEEPSQEKKQDNSMEVDVRRPGTVADGNPRRLSPLVRLCQPNRGERMFPEIRRSTLAQGLMSLRLGTEALPPHLARPVSLYNHYHLLTRRRGHMNEVFFVQYDRTGTRIFTGSDDWLIKVWSTHTGLLVQTLRGHKGAITYLCVDPTNRYLASASEDNSIRIWSLDTYSTVCVLLDVHTKPVVDLSWSHAPQIGCLISMSQDGFVRVWEPEISRIKNDIDTLLGKDTSLQFREIPFDCNQPINGGCLSPAGTRMLSSSKDGSVRIFALNPPRQIQRIVAHGSNVPVAAWSNSARRFLTASDDGTAKIYEYKGPEIGWALQFTISILEAHGPKPKMHLARWTTNDDFIILAFQRTALHNNHNLKVFDAQTGALLGCLDGHTNDVHAMALHPKDPRILATAGYDQRIFLWNLYTRQAVKELRLPDFEDEESPITEIAFHPEGHQLCVSDLIGCITIFGIGPTDSFKGPVEQFFTTDYNATTMDDHGFVVDTDTQLPPSMVPRSQLCFRGGRLHDNPPSLPLLRDPRTIIPSREADQLMQLRATDAELEDNTYLMGPPPEPQGRAPRPAGAAVGVGGGAAGVAPARPHGTAGNIARVTSTIPGRGRGVGGAAAAATTTTAANTPSRAPSVGTNTTGVTGGRLRRNNSQPLSTGPSSLGPGVQRTSTRPIRNASRRNVASMDFDEDMIDMSSEDEATARAIYAATLELEDQEEEDFIVQGESDDDSISSDGDGRRVSHHIDDDLYWSGNEDTEGRATRLTAAERALRREARRLHQQQGGGSPAPISRRPSRAAAEHAVRIMEDDYDSEESYGAKKKSKKKSNPKPPASNSKPPSKKRKPTPDEMDSEMDAQSSSSLDIPLFDSSEDEAADRKRKRAGSRPKAPKYPSWVVQRQPSAIFCPQLGDELVFFRTGYSCYVQAFPDWDDPIPEEIDEVTYCTVTNLEFSAEPFIHCLVTLTVIAPQPPLPIIDTDPSHESSVMQASNALESGQNEIDQADSTPQKKRLRVTLTRAPQAKPFVSMASKSAQLAASSAAAAYGNLQPAPLSFTVHYHGGVTEVPDFLVLASRFNQGMETPWYPGKRVNVWMGLADNPAIGEFYAGQVLDVNTEWPWEALTVVWEDENSGDPLKISPWEVDTFDEQGNPVPVLVEAIPPASAQALASNIEDFTDKREEQCRIFMEPVPLDQYPSYYSTNPWPVDLQLIMDRLRGGWYRNLESLKRDIQHIHLNSKKFNTAGPLVNCANTITRDLLHLIDRASQEASHLVMVPRVINEASMEDDESAPSKSKSKSKKRKEFEEEEDEDVDIEEDSDIDDDDEDEYGTSSNKKKKKTPISSSTTTAGSAASKKKQQPHSKPAEEEPVVQDGISIDEIPPTLTALLKRPRSSSANGSTAPAPPASSSPPPSNNRKRKTKSALDEGDEDDAPAETNKKPKPTPRRGGKSTTPQEDEEHQVDQSTLEEDHVAEVKAVKRTGGTRLVVSRRPAASTPTPTATAADEEGEVATPTKGRIRVKAKATAAEISSSTPEATTTSSGRPARARAMMKLQYLDEDSEDEEDLYDESEEDQGSSKSKPKRRR